ncbi:MAG: hypothetical protein SFV55_29230 [Haliscomenobacter sp.]|uniref:hypothetical protein n=1 Tax=Haliscomenobacter sp. TaxID=2717303 RepID=UPI0029B7A1DB|nr:hypothetical protein [Haliscomenobacter sp.]MDX2072553.1 hypothetical protein [Haliscomenobacter sp.]
MLDRVQIYSILGQVLSRLADQGTALSVDQHLRLATLLDQLRAPLSREQLSLLLTPILANTPETQTNLHRWFAEAILLVPAKEKNPIVAPPKLPKDSLPPVPETMNQVSENDVAESESPKPFDLDASVDAPSPSETYVAELQTFDKPPYVWTVELGAEREFATTADFRQLANRMHDRQLLEAHELDITATINTLVKQPGQVALHYRELSQAPSYLLLIDQRAQNDHRAKIFDLLYTYLQFNEVQVSRFYFHADPKLCFNDDYPLGIPVAQLYPQNRSARLLILTYGYELFSSSTNAWSLWTKVFLQWKDRAILSPLPTRSWGAMEQRLAERFTILPATPLGLAAAIEEFQAEDTQHWEEYLALITDAPTEPVYYQGDLIYTLEQYYPDPVIRRWIAACALYPTLHWELTLHIGTLLQREYSHPNLTSVENLLELVRLPWFVDGHIPDQARDELVKWLEATGEETRIGSLLLESLDRAPAPPDGSVAYADYRMQVVFNQWMLEQDAVKKAELENEFLLFLEAGKAAEFVTLKRLERAAKRTEFVVPAHWRKKILQLEVPVHVRKKMLQLDLPFRNNFSQFCYDLNIYNSTLSNVLGFEQLGYTNENFRNIYNIEEIIHPSTLLRYAYQAQAAYQYIFENYHSFSQYELSNIIYQNYVIIRSANYEYYRTQLTCKLNFEVVENECRMIVNKTVGQIFEKIEIDDENRPLDLVVQYPSVSIDGKIHEKMVIFIVEQANIKHMEKLNLTPHECQIMSLLAKNYLAPQIAEIFGEKLYDMPSRTKKIQRIRAYQKRILAKCRVEFAFDTASQAARHYRKYRMF